MRRAALPSLLIALLLAGCAFPQGDDTTAEPASTPAPGGETAPDPSPTPTQPTPKPTPPTPSPTPATPTPPPRPPESNSTAPATNSTNSTNESEGLVVFNGSFDFSSGAALVPLSASDTFEVPDGWEQLVVNVTFVAKGNAQATDRDTSIGLAPPPGLISLATVSGTAGSEASMSTTAVPGTWTLRYEGQGPIEALIVARVL